MLIKCAFVGHKKLWYCKLSFHIRQSHPLTSSMHWSTFQWYWGLDSNYCPGQKGFDFTVPLTGCLVPSADLVQSLSLPLPIGLPWDSIFLSLALIGQSSDVSSLLHNLHAVSCQMHIMEVRVWSQAIPCWNAVDGAAVKQVPLQVSLFSPFSIIPLFHTQI
jgi:hypothetical protein